jgi:hypothetical protein
MLGNPFETKIIKTKKLKGITLQVSQNDHSKRILVDFFATNAKLKVQKSFQDSFEGRKEAKEFEKQFKTLSDLKKYFGLV